MQVEQVIVSPLVSTPKSYLLGPVPLASAPKSFLNNLENLTACQWLSQ
jgi:hypothetical protein